MGESQGSTKPQETKEEKASSSDVKCGHSVMLTEVKKDPIWGKIPRFGVSEVITELDECGFQEGSGSSCSMHGNPPEGLLQHRLLLSSPP